MRAIYRLLLAFSGCALFTLAGCGGSGSGGRPGGAPSTGDEGTGGSTLVGGGTGGNGSVLPGAGGMGTGPSTCSCDPSDPNAACNRTAPPGCGDGIINQATEECDDGNSKPGDGCSGVCKKEPYFECPTAGQPCVSTIVCGDGVRGPGEACDDGNSKPGDGCNETCTKVEPGYVCKTPGQKCTPVYLCGDGIVDPNEGCDDANSTEGDGCDPHCRIEAGFKCEGSPSHCTATKCGDHVMEGAESCDDGNAIPFDGCSATCQAEPSCPASGGACTSTCGDGIKLGANEECDDGNLRDGDGCSHDCKVESGFKCTQPDMGDKILVPVIYRDFKFHAPSDFEAGVTGSNDAATGMVQGTLDADGKPVYTGATGSAVHVESTATFAEWYRNTDGVNHATATTLALYNDGQGAYVNRYGANGEQWNVTEPANWCGGVGQELMDDQGNPIPCTFQYQSDQNQTDCMKEEAKGYTQLPGSCHADQGTYKAQYIVKKVDGNPLFFPIDDDTFSKADMTGAQVPSTPANLYDASGTWPWDLDAAGNKILHNFSFTSEVRYWFKYDASKTYTLDFVGDDDVWVFINKKLAVDLGGIHTPVDGTITLDAAQAGKLGLSDGNVYEAAIFQAERQTTCSSYKLTLSGFNMSPSDCSADCGDGVVAAGEQCDDGTDSNTGDYNHCSPTCTLGPRCGDGQVQSDQGEECDDGTNAGDYNGCGPDCKAGPHCGDGVVQSDKEQCYDGVNDGSYGTCNPDCTLAPRCGDGVVQPDHEQCDDSSDIPNDPCNNHVGSGGCTDTCQWSIVN